MTANPPDIIRVGAHRVRIRGAVPNAMIGWLKKRSDVVAFDRKLSALDVSLNQPSGPFVRALQDFLHTQDPPASWSVQASPVMAGRVRLRLTGTGDDDLVRLAAFVAALPGVTRAQPSPASDSILLLFDPTVTNAQTLLSVIRTSDPKRWPATSKGASPKKQARLTAFNSAVLAAAASAVLPEALLSVAVGLTAIPTLRRTARALRDKRLGVDALDVAAISASVATGQYATGAFITWLLGLGDLLLESTADRAHSAVSKLLHLDAREAWCLRDGQVEPVDPKAIKVGDHLVIAAGQSVAADGIVISGCALVDEKALTGESLPRERREGERILAATIVVEGQVVIAVERTGGDTTAAKIVKILEGYGQKPMTLQRDVERVADRLVLPTFMLAGGVFALSGQIARSTSVLITDFGTGIRIAVPMNALTSMTLAARQGVLVKGAQYLERLSKADVIVFDKTGTLTAGRPDIVDAQAFSGFSLADVSAWACGLEQRQSHPIAEAFRQFAVARLITPLVPELGTEEHAMGLGLSACIAGRRMLFGSKRWLDHNGVSVQPAETLLQTHGRDHASSLLLSVDGVLAGVFAFRDQVRPESARVVHALKANGRRRVVLLSGDACGPVQAVAEELGVDEAIGEMMPHEKARYVQEQQAAGRVVAMVGDGINDAPALALADVGISLHEGTDVALETADVVLLEAGLDKLLVAFETGDFTMRQVRRSLGLVIVPNTVAMALGALGLISPALASILNNGSTVLAALTATAPLLRKKP